MLGSLCAAMSVALTFGQAGYYEEGPVETVSEFGRFDSTGFGGELYPFDTHYPWVHGYFQEIPAYGGYVSFRPYNYKHVTSQSQAAGGFGMNPTMPYSQQYWHRYHQRASLRQDLSQAHGSPYGPNRGDYAQSLNPHQFAPVAPATHYSPLNAPAPGPALPSYPQLFQR